MVVERVFVFETLVVDAAVLARAESGAWNAGQDERRHEVAPDVRRLEAREEHAVELVQLVLRQFSRRSRVTGRELLHVGDLGAPREALAEADADGGGQQRVEARVEVGGDPEQVEEEPEHDGPLGGELVDEHWRKETRREHRQMHDAHGDDAQTVASVDTRLDVLDGTEGGEDEDEAGCQHEQVASACPAAASHGLAIVSCLAI